MRLATRSFELISNPCHTLQYENLVRNLEPTMQAVVKFLGIEWNDAVLEYRELASRKVIHTPSYQQVVRPLYSDSINRWQRYRGEMEPQLSVLGQWAVRFGYEA